MQKFPLNIPIACTPEMWKKSLLTRQPTQFWEKIIPPKYQAKMNISH